MKHSLFLFCLLIAFGTLQAANAIYRDSSGRSIGTATTQSNGSVIFRDASGRQVGTASSGQALPPPDTIFFKP